MVSLSVSVSLSLSVCLSVSLSAVCLALSFCLSLSLFVRLFLYVCLCLSVWLSLSLFCHNLSLSSCLSVYTPSPTLRSTSDDKTHSCARWKLKGLGYQPFSVQKLPLLTPNTAVLSHSSKRLLNIFSVLAHSVLL